MNITQRKDIIVFFAILGLAFFIGYKKLYPYNLKEMAKIETQIEEETKKNEILKDISGLNQKLVEYQKRSFKTADITPLVDKISQLAQQTGIEIKTYNPASVLERGQYIESLLKIPFSCNYHQLGQLLSLIENNQEFIWVKELKMTKATVTEPEAKRTPKIDLTVSGIYLKR